MKRLLITLFILSSFFSRATTYYVKAAGGTGTGLDSNTQAWSLARFNTMASSLGTNDKVLVRSGDVFNGQLSPATNNLYIGKYGTRANPLFDNTILLSSWTQVGTSNIYWAPLSATIVNGVSLDGTIRGMGRYPDNDTSYIQYTSSTTNSITGTGVSTLPVNFVGAEMVVKKQRYILDRVKVTAISGNTITFRKDSKYGPADGDPSNGDGFFMQGHLSTLNREGEWFFDSTAQRMYMHFGTGSSTGRTVKVNLLNTVNLGGMNHITFENLDFSGGEKTIVLFSCDSISIRNCNIKNTGIGVYGNYCTRVAITNSNISYTYVGSILFDDHNDNCTITGTSCYYSGMYPGLGNSGDYSLNGLLLNGNGNRITNNSIVKTGFNGIYFEGSDLLVQYNFVDSFCILKDDGGGIYTWTNLPGTSSSAYTGTMANRTISNNIITNSIGCPYGALMDGNNFGESSLIYLDGYSNHTTVNNNYAAHSCYNGIFMNSNSYNTITNNVVFDQKYGLHIDRTPSKTPNPADTYVTNLNISGNQFIARTADQMTLLINLFANDNPSGFGTWSSNIYARPISEGSTIDVHYWYGGQNTPHFQTVPQWKSTYSVDVASSASVVTTTDPTAIQTLYNTSNSTSIVSLGATFKDVYGATYSSIPLPTYNGAVIIYYAPLGPSTPKVFMTPGGKLVIISNKIAVP